jgi:hypothetical protein
MFGHSVTFGRTPLRGRPAQIPAYALTNLHLPNGTRPRQAAAVAVLIERAIREGQALIVHDARLTDEDIERIRAAADEHGRIGHIVEIRDASDAPDWHPYDPGAISHPDPRRFGSIHLHGFPERLEVNRHHGTAYSLMNAAGYFLAGSRSSAGETFSSSNVLAAALDERKQDEIVALFERDGMHAMSDTVELHRSLANSASANGHRHRTLINVIKDSVNSVDSVRCSVGDLNLQRVLDRKLICIIRTKPDSKAGTLVAADLYYSMQRYYISRLGSDSAAVHPGDLPWPQSTIVVGDTSGLRVRERDLEPHHLPITGLARHCRISLVMPTNTDEIPSVAAFEGGAANLCSLVDKPLGLHRLNWTLLSKSNSAFLKVA